MPAQPTLYTARLLLRPFAPADAAAVHEIVSDREIAANTLHIPHPYPEGMAAEWIGSQEPKWEKGDGVVFAAVLREGGALVAAVGLELEPPHRRGELGYWVARPHWSRGYATEASRAVVRFGFAELGLNRVQARHYSRNPSSGAVMRKLGMRWEGRLRQHVYKWGTYEDLEIYGLLREEVLDGDEPIESPDPER